MTVEDLAKQLEQMPQDAEIYVATECHGCFEPADHIKLDDRGMVVIDSGLPR
jgi:hypothetical protein